VEGGWLLLAANPEGTDEISETLPQFLEAFQALIVAAAAVSQKPSDCRRAAERPVSRMSEDV
jgi:hypothetical protein